MESSAMPHKTKYEVAHESWLYHTANAKACQCRLFKKFHQTRASELYRQMAAMAELIPTEKLLHDLNFKQEQ